MTAKVHKSPWKMRPIVCCAGTFMNCWSQWLDYHLQELKPHVPTFLKDGQQVLDELRSINLPAGALLATADAQSMYNNIDTDHAIQVIDWWLDDLNQQNKLPLTFPLDAVKAAYRIIMKNNIFEWGDLCFLQLLGTAMGTSAAVMWATLYNAYHEVHTLIPRHGQHLVYFKRFIDDIFCVWKGNTTTDWEAFCADINNFGILKWDIEEPSTSVDFLDLTLTIEGSRIVSKTFQKAMNLYLYIPPASAHPEGCIKGTVYGLINRYYAQNTYRKDYLDVVVKLYRRLLARGWDRVFIRQLILEATSRVEGRANTTTSTTRSERERDANERALRLHIQFHPNDISRREYRSLYEHHLGELLREELDVECPTVAYSRQRNIGDYVTQAKLHQAPGKSASTIMGEFRQGLEPS
jgi:hypothetical protein